MIINVGRNDPAKYYLTLFKAIGLVYEKYKNFSFFQIGAGLDLKNEFRQLENIRFKGLKELSQDKLIDYYHAAEVYVSSSKHESFGKVLVEALAAGLPVVATATTGSKEIVKDGENGFLVSIGDSEALARKIIYLLNNPHEYNKLKTGALEQASQLSWEKTSREFQKIIDKAQISQLKKIHMIDFTESGFKQELMKPNRAFIDAVKKGAVLYGQENFIRLIKSIIP